jgi:hypothetical protein
MTGEDVKTLQRALNKNPHWDADFLQGSAVDGEFGLYTAQAVYRAKYWLGYRTPDKSGGELLVRRLTMQVDITPEMKQRRADRLAKKAAEPLRLKALAKMKGHLGEKEHPAGSNICVVTKKWHIYGPWCCMGVSEAYIEAGSKSFRRSTKYTSCGVIAAAAEQGRDGLSVTKDPKPGDLVLMKWPGLSSYRFDHIEMVEQALPLKTIGCNTSPDAGGSQANGGMCCRKDREDERKAGIIRMYIHVSS